MLRHVIIIRRVSGVQRNWPHIYNIIITQKRIVRSYRSSNTLTHTHTHSIDFKRTGDSVYGKYNIIIQDCSSEMLDLLNRIHRTPYVLQINIIR